MKAEAILALVLLLGGCVHADGASDAALPALAADRSQPRLALLDHVLSGYFASDIASRPTTCVAVNEGGPARALAPGQETMLMMRHASLAPLARCRWTESGWTDAMTGKPALVFTLYGFSCTGDGECSGYSSYTAGKVAGISQRYTMAWGDGAWHFTRDARLIIAGPGNR